MRLLPFLLQHQLLLLVSGSQVACLSSLQGQVVLMVQQFLGQHVVCCLFSVGQPFPTVCVEEQVDGTVSERKAVCQRTYVLGWLGIVGRAMGRARAKGQR